MESGDGHEAREERRSRTPSRRELFPKNIKSPTGHAANLTQSKYRRLKASPLNPITRRLLLAKLEREKQSCSNAENTLTPVPG